MTRPISDHTAFGLTPRQYDCLRFIKQYEGLHGCAPSYAEIMAALDLHSRASVHRLIEGLAARGHVIRLPYRRRTVRVVSDPEGRAVAVEFIRQRILEGWGLHRIMESIDRPVEFVTEGEVIEAVRLAWREMQPREEQKVA